MKPMDWFDVLLHGSSICCCLIRILVMKVVKSKFAEYLSKSFFGFLPAQGN